MSELFSHFDSKLIYDSRLFWFDSHSIHDLRVDLVLVIMALVERNDERRVEKKTKRRLGGRVQDESIRHIPIGWLTEQQEHAHNFHFSQFFFSSYFSWKYRRFTRKSLIHHQTPAADGNVSCESDGLGKWKHQRWWNIE